MAQGYTLLHDPLNAASTAFLALFGSSGAVITGHDACVAAYPSIQGFPTVVYQDAGGADHFLFNPESMAAVTAWSEGIDTALSSPATLGPIIEKGIFLTQMITPQEGAAMELAVTKDTTGELIFAKSVYENESVIDLRSTALSLYLNAMVAAGALTAARVTQILAGIPVSTS